MFVAGCAGAVPPGCCWLQFLKSKLLGNHLSTEASGVVSFYFFVRQVSRLRSTWSAALVGTGSVVSVQFPSLPLEGCCVKICLMEILWSCCDGAILLGPLSNIRITLRCTSVSPTLRPWREGNTSTVGAVRSVGVTSFVVRSSCGLFGVLVTLVGRFGAHLRRRMCAGAACTRIARHYRVRGLEQVEHPSHQYCMHHLLMLI